MIKNYKEMKKLYKEKGGKEILNCLDENNKFQLYNFSLDWLESDEFILKANGTYGDVIVDWEHKYQEQIKQN